MYLVNAASLRAYRLDKAREVTVKYLLHAGIGARRLQLRLFTVEPSGYTPLERHEHEHEVYVLRGRLLVRGGDGGILVSPGDALFIASMEPHQFLNPGEEPAKFLCTKETGEVPEILKRIKGSRGE